MVNYTRKKGGKYLGEGTYGCVFGDPPLKCKGDNERSTNDIVSKVMERKNAKKELIESDLWKKIDPEQDFSISAIKICSFDKKYNSKNEPEKCLSKFKPMNRKKILNKKRDTLIFYKFGGLDLIKLKPHAKNYKAIFTAIHPLLKGLEKAHDNNIVHLDIKRDNIVSKIENNKIVLRFIDFGLSLNINALNPERPYKSTYSRNDTFYPFWPPELGCFDNEGILEADWRIRCKLEEHNYMYNSEISTIYNLPRIQNRLSDVYNMYLDVDFKNYKKVLKSIDMYSIGVLLSSLLYSYFSHVLDGSFNVFYHDSIIDRSSRFETLKSKKWIKDEQVDFHSKIYENISKPIAKLIESLCNIDPNKRITVSEAVKEYEKILPAFEKYLNSKEITEKLDDQNILNKTADIPHIETPIAEPFKNLSNSITRANSINTRLSPNNKSIKRITSIK